MQSCCQIFPIWFCWGSNNFGESEKQPLLKNGRIVDASIGRHQVCTVVNFDMDELDDTEGILHCWGDDSSGQQDVKPGWAINISKVAAGDFHTCAIMGKRCGCWGENTYGQLYINDADIANLDIGGDDKNVEGRGGRKQGRECNGKESNSKNGAKCTEKNTQERDPSDVLDDWYKYQISKQEVTKVVVRNHSTCILDDQGIHCFGKIHGSILEYDSRSETLFDLQMGQNHVCFFQKGLNCIGENDQHQLEHPKVDSISYMTSQSDFSCLVTRELSENVLCWGDNKHRQQDVTTDNWNITFIESGHQHTCILVGLWYINCFGTKQHKLNKIPKEITQVAMFVSVGGSFSCAMIGGSLKCFGKNKNNLFNQPKQYEHGLNVMTAGYNHLCASDLNLTNDKSSLACWGLRDNESIEVPSAINTELFSNKDLNAGQKFTCAIMSQRPNKPQNRIVCWGLNDQGQLLHPSLVVTEGMYKGLDTVNEWFLQIRLGLSHGCVTTFSRGIQCWGRNDKGQATVPEHSSSDVEHVTAGYMHTCAVTQGKRAACWGLNTSGQADVPLGMWTIMEIMWAGGKHTCGMDQTLKSRCWGSNSHGQLGLNKNRVQSKVMSLGELHTCQIDNQHNLNCYGDNKDGQSDTKNLFQDK